MDFVNYANTPPMFIILVKTERRRYSRLLDRKSSGIEYLTFHRRFTVEPRFNGPPYNEVLDVTNHFPGPSDSKIFEKEPRYNETSK